MNGYQYEKYVAKYLKRNGYRRVQVTKASGDYGADITARKGGRKYAVQCKYYSNPVGLKAVQEVVAAKKHYRCRGAIVVTNNRFTKPAKLLASENNVCLIENVRPVRLPKDKGLFEKLLPSLIIFSFAITFFMIAINRI